MPPTSPGYKRYRIDLKISRPVWGESRELALQALLNVINSAPVVEFDEIHIRETSE